MDELLKYEKKNGRSRDLLYVMTCQLNILVGHSGQIPVGAIRTIVKILALRVIVCYLDGLFSVVFPKKHTIKYSNVTRLVGCYLSYKIKVVETGQAASSAMIKPNPGGVISVFSDVFWSTFLSVSIFVILSFISLLQRSTFYGNTI